MEGFDNEPSSDEESFEDEEEELLPVATPVYLNTNSTTLPQPPPVVNSTPSYDSNQFDPFSPAASNSNNNNNNDNEAFDLLSMPSTTSSDAPVLIPMNPNADGDLLGGSISISTKQASKKTKDPKMKHLLYDDDDDYDNNEDLLLGNSAPKQNQDTGDNFVDDDSNNNAPQSGGFFSRLGNRIRASTNEADNNNNNNKSSETAKLTASDENNEDTLQIGGNSLPHPDTLRPGSTRDHIQEGSNDDDSRSDSDIDSDSEDGLDGNGKSLPHPEEVLRRSKKKIKNNNDNNNNDNDKKEPDAPLLDENGMSLPHPETVMRKANGDSKNVPLNDTVTPFLNEDGNSSSTSSKSEDNARLMAALEAASNQSSSDDEDIYVEDEDDDYSNDDDDDKSGNSSSSSSGFGGDYLGGNGNSLPHPDEYAINKSSGHSGSAMMSSFKWGNIKMSLRSTFSKTNDKGDIESVSDDGEDFADETTSRANKRDEEMGYYSNGDDNDASSSESDSDSDFSDEEPASKKDRMLSLFKEHKDNPRSRLICLVSFIVFLLLFIVTPVAVRKTKAKNNIITTTTDIGNTPGDEIGPIIPPPISSDGSNCFDEIVLTDRNGRDLVNGTDTSDDLACYSIDEPIHFRFKRCRPASPLDWVGVFSSRSMFMDKLWKDHYDGVYLCGDQPCPDDDSLNMEGGPPRIQATKAPPIKTPGEYRLFLVKDSDWPYEFVKHTAAFHVVDSPHICANKDNIFTPPTPNSGGKATESVYVDLPTMVPTAPVSSVGSVAATTWDSVTSTPEEFNSIGTRE